MKSSTDWLPHVTVHEHGGFFRTGNVVVDAVSELTRWSGLYPATRRARRGLVTSMSRHGNTQSDYRVLAVFEYIWSRYEAVNRSGYWESPFDTDLLWLTRADIQRDLQLAECHVKEALRILKECELIGSFLEGYQSERGNPCQRPLWHPNPATVAARLEQAVPASGLRTYLEVCRPELVGPLEELQSGVRTPDRLTYKTQGCNRLVGVWIPPGSRSLRRVDVDTDGGGNIWAPSWFDLVDLIDHALSADERADIRSIAHAGRLMDWPHPLVDSERAAYHAVRRYVQFGREDPAHVSAVIERVRARTHHRSLERLVDVVQRHVRWKMNQGMPWNRALVASLTRLKAHIRPGSAHLAPARAVAYYKGVEAEMETFPGLEADSVLAEQLRLGVLDTVLSDVVYYVFGESRDGGARKLAGVGFQQVTHGDGRLLIEPPVTGSALRTDRSARRSPERGAGSSSFPTPTPRRPQTV